MLSQLDGFRIPFELNGEMRYLRYNLNSKLYLEYMTENNMPTDEAPSAWDFDDILHYLRAMLIDSFYEENREYIERRDFAKCKPYLSDLGRYLDEHGMDGLVNSILKAFSESLPIAPIGAEKTPNPQAAV